jgi:hypothetical protein
MSPMATNLTVVSGIAAAFLTVAPSRIPAQVPAPCPSVYTFPGPFMVPATDFTGLKSFMDFGAEFTPTPSPSNGIYYPGVGDPDPVDVTGSYFWRSAWVGAKCVEEIDPSGNQFIFILATGAQGGHAVPVTGGNGGNCDYQLYPNPDQCTDPDPGGSGGGTGGGAPPSGGGGNECEALQLAPGCYDVYVDNQYDSTICC